MAPPLLAGIFIAGFLFGRPGSDGLVPQEWVMAVFDSSTFLSNFGAAAAGGLMYFCTMTEVPVIDGLMGSGMHKGPALALLLAGPTISIPQMLIASGIIGMKKTSVYAGLVIIFSAFAGMIYGSL